MGLAFHDRFKHCLDQELWARIFVRHPVGYLAVSDCEFRRHGASHTRTGGRSPEAWFEHVEQSEALVERHLPGVGLRRLRRRSLSDAVLTVALDACEKGEGARALALLGRALRTYPPSLIDPRVGASLVTLALGAPGRRALARLRAFQRRRDIRVHLSELKDPLRDLLLRKGSR